jgi:hypothetical protein
MNSDKQSKLKRKSLEQNFNIRFRQRGLKEYATITWNGTVENHAWSRVNHIVKQVYPTAVFTSGGSFSGGTWRLNPEVVVPKKVKVVLFVRFNVSSVEHIDVRPGELNSTIDKTAGRGQSRSGGLEYFGAMHGIEALMLAMATAGIRMHTKEMHEAVQTAVEAMTNEFAE